MITTNATVHALLNRIIDYAGLFPPAELPMDQTVRNYADYLRGEDAWMLGRLIVPVTRLDEFEQHAAEHLPKEAGDEAWVISAIASPAGSDEIADDLKRIGRFNTRHAEPANGLARIDVIEVAGKSARAIETTIELVPDEIYPYFELPIAADPRGLIAALVGNEAGAKVRTGGVSPETVPQPEHLARFLSACAAADVPFKATAGLHHPLRHMAESLGVKEHGFLNVFLAACLAMQHELEEADIEAVLEEQSLDAFTITPERITWRECGLRPDDIEDVRETFAASFGSCSFDEPREHLRALGLL